MTNEIDPSQTDIHYYALVGPEFLGPGHLDMTYPGFGDRDATEPASFPGGRQGSNFLNYHGNFSIEPKSLPSSNSFLLLSARWPKILIFCRNYSGDGGSPPVRRYDLLKSAYFSAGLPAYVTTRRDQRLKKD